MVKDAAIGPSVYRGLKELPLPERVQELSARLKEHVEFEGLAPTPAEVSSIVAGSCRFETCVEVLRQADWNCCSLHVMRRLPKPDQLQRPDVIWMVWIHPTLSRVVDDASARQHKLCLTSSKHRSKFQAVTTMTTVTTVVATKPAVQSQVLKTAVWGVPAVKAARLKAAANHRGEPRPPRRRRWPTAAAAQKRKQSFRGVSHSLKAVLMEL